MTITSIVANELGLTNYEEIRQFATINGVTISEIQSYQGFYRVQLVRDSHYLNIKLEEGSKLAAYYNSRFWHELIGAEKIDIKSAKFKTAFQVSDNDALYSVYVTSFENGTVKKQLDLTELEQVAREIAKLHAINSKVVSDEFSTAVEENYENIRSYRRKIQGDLCDILNSAVSSEMSKYFAEPAKVIKKVESLIEYIRNSERESEDDHRVITHGRLTFENCRFDQNGQLVEISDWENIHLGNPAEDLTNLIISSADHTIRRNSFMKIFHQYFYTLVDIRPPKYQLSDLKHWYRENLARAVVYGIEQLLLILSESTDENDKLSATHKWEGSLDDAIDFISGNYMSDDEQVFFSNK